MDRDKLREKIASLFMVECKDCFHGENLENDCPHLDEDICEWQRELADRVIALIPDIEEAKREEGERIGGFIEQNRSVQGKRHIPWWEVAEKLKRGQALGEK